jgi:phosphoribosylglycinamide formyltransferase-1
MQAIIEACNQKKLDATTVCVISNRPDAPGLSVAKRLGVETHVVDHRKFPSRAEFESALIALIDCYEPDFVLLAGFMRILESAFVNHYSGRLINIHPSLLPKYPGINTHQRAIEAGDAHHGATIHLVTSDLDGGPLLSQIVIDIQAGETSLALAERLIAYEHTLYIQTLNWLLSGTLQWRDDGLYFNQVLQSKPVRLSDGDLKSFSNQRTD